MVMIVSAEGYLAEEGVDLAGALAVAGFVRAGWCVVGQEGAVVVEGGDDVFAIAHEGVAQALFEPFGAFADALSVQAGFGFGDEGLGFAEFFVLGCLLEYFLASGWTAGVSAARMDRVSLMLSWAVN